MFLLFLDSRTSGQLRECSCSQENASIVDWISGKVACMGVPIARLLFLLVTRLECDMMH